MRCTILCMPRDFTHGRFPPKKPIRDAVGGKVSLAFKIAFTVFLLFWMSMPTRALVEMLTKEKLANLREAPFPAVIMILIMSIFPIAGVAGLISIWRPRKPAGQSAEEPPFSSKMPPVQPPSGKASRQGLGIGNFILPLFGIIFVGIGVFAGKVQLDKILAQRAINWQTTTGTVLSSEVRHKDKGYSAHVSYRYVVDGKTFENDKLSPTEFTTSQRSDIVRHVAKYKPGAEVTIHYNQANPSESLLEPARAMEYALLLFPLPFIIAGLVAFSFGLKFFLPSRTFQPFDTPLTGLKLKRTGGEPGAKILFTCVWCVFTFVFTTIWFMSAGGFSWTRDFWTFDKFFVLIFPAIGIALAVSCVRDVLRRALTGRYEIEIACDRLLPGARVQVTYKFNGDATRLTHVVFTLTQESMSFQQQSDYSMASKDVVCKIDDPMRARYGTFVMTIPKPINWPRISWRLIVKYAGITDTFRLDVG